MPTPSLDSTVRATLHRMEDFEASGSVANTGTGARREGEDFEHLLSVLWTGFASTAAMGGATAAIIAGPSNRQYTKLSCAGRDLIVPIRTESDRVTNSDGRWLEVSFGVSDLVASYPSEMEAVRRFAPASGRYANSDYPSIYDGLSTRFDDTIVLVENGVLKEKILLEYKTAKSSGGRQLDGNAHERLSFQVMQYLEVATRYTKCSLVVLANGAFVKYRNKYHVNFHIQSQRLRCFSWFSMRYLCVLREYERFLDGLLGWLFDGANREGESQQ